MSCFDTRIQPASPSSDGTLKHFRSNIICSSTRLAMSCWSSKLPTKLVQACDKTSRTFDSRKDSESTWKKRGAHRQWWCQWLKCQLSAEILLRVSNMRPAGHNNMPWCFLGHSCLRHWKKSSGDQIICAKDSLAKWAMINKRLLYQGLWITNAWKMYLWLPSQMCRAGI
jgi:hypothetical protein